MFRKIIVFITIVLMVSVAFAQNGQGTIKGKMLDKVTKEPLPFANVAVYKGGALITGAQTDFDGNFTITALSPGAYDLEAKYIGYQSIKKTGVNAIAGKIVFVNFDLGSGVELDVVQVQAYKEPLIKKDNASTGGTLSRDAISKLPTRSAASIAATVGGVASQDDGSGSLSVRGTSGSATDTYIDGIKVRGSQNLPSSAIEQVTVITGGLPAQYGDVTGGIINITTRGPSKQWFGGVEYLTSGFKNGDDVVGLDDHGYNLFGFSLSGPLVIRKDSLGNKKDALLGFFLSGEARHNLDNSPTPGTNFKLKDGVLERLQEDPILVGPGVSGVINNANFIRAEDIEETPYKLNSIRKSVNLAGKVDIVASPTVNLTVGGSFDYIDANAGSAANLFNFQNNIQSINRTWRTYARFTQRFANESDESSSSLVKNAFLSFQVDYTNTHSKTQDETHQDRLSDYGYIGKFTSTREDIFQNVLDTVIVVDSEGNATGETHIGFLSNSTVTQYDYEAGDINPILANYTSNYYNAFEGNPVGNFERIEDVQGNGGLVNGDGTASIYSLFAAQGAPNSTYSFSNTTQFRVSGSGSADLKGHAIKVGFEYEQRNDKSYSINAGNLWTTGRSLVNTQIIQNSFEEGTFTVLNGQGGNSIDNILLSQAYDAETHNQFDKNIREKLGLSETGTEFIDFDSFGSDLWTIDDFSADEIHQNSAGNLNNVGYDHTGEKISSDPSLNDFFNAVDENGQKTRLSPAFKPIYVAGYIQDQFSFDDLIFNVGIRLDRYDANQSVLKDPFTLFPARTLSEIGFDGAPSNIGDDFVVYVNDVTNPNVDDIAGYRDGDIWYNALGEEISDPSILNPSTGIPEPWLVNPSENVVFNDLDENSFEDFEPEINVSPRIAFSFPISDEAGFFANYDVLAQRPQGSNRLDLTSLLFFDQGGITLNNPDLKTEKTISYELGFQQVLSRSSSLRISTFYREIRDQIALRQIIGAFPGNYTTFDNLDFGTTKGLTVTYDLRRTGNLTLRLAYTLLFAEGSGGIAGQLIAANEGALRTLLPLNQDQRHTTNITVDYRYGSGKNYTGPVVGGKDILKNTGLNMVINANTGRPYTRTSRIVSALQGGVNSPQEGQTNASRLPFVTTVNARLDRTFDLKWGKGEDQDRKTASLNVYIQSLNLLDAQNIFGVYSATGNADDDGYLGAPEWQSTIAQSVDEQSLRDLYTTRLASDVNYSLPRRVRLGIQLNF